MSTKEEPMQMLPSPLSHIEVLDLELEEDIPSFENASIMYRG